MPGEKSLPVVEIINDKADSCQVLQISGDAKPLTQHQISSKEG